MIDEIGYRIALVLFPMMVIAVIGSLIILIRWIVFGNQVGLLFVKLIPLIVYGIYPLMADYLLNNIKNPQTFLPYVRKQQQLILYVIIASTGLVLLVLYYLYFVF